MGTDNAFIAKITNEKIIEDLEKEVELYKKIAYRQNELLSKVRGITEELFKVIKELENKR